MARENRQMNTNTVPHDRAVSVRYFEANEIALFRDASAWETESKSDLFPRTHEERSTQAPGIREIAFTGDFDIRDAHLDDIVAQGEFFCRSLGSLELGNSDTGYGSQLTDAAVIRLAQACPNLSVLRLQSCAGLTDAALIAILENVKWIAIIEISGNDKVKGHVRGPALQALKQRPELGSHLVELELSDQWSTEEFRKAVDGLRKARKGLKINAIQSDSDSAFFWNSCMSGSYPYVDDFDF